jgi:biopolymer transport protein ExbD
VRPLQLTSISGLQAGTLPATVSSAQIDITSIVNLMLVMAIMVMMMKMMGKATEAV